MKRFTTWALGGIIGGVIVALLWSVGVNAENNAKISTDATPNDSSARQRLAEICNRTLSVLHVSLVDTHMRRRRTMMIQSSLIIMNTAP